MIPDAVAAAIQGVLDSNPAADRTSLGRLIVRELRRDGWQIAAPIPPSHNVSRSTAVHPLHP